jgi:hypothetical protein
MRDSDDDISVERKPRDYLTQINISAAPIMTSSQKVAGNSYSCNTTRDSSLAIMGNIGEPVTSTAFI